MSVSYMIGGRGSGKTTFLIMKSAELGIPIVCNRPEYVSEMAKAMGIDIPEPISYYQAVHDRKNEKVCIDEIELFLRAIGINPVYITIDGSNVKTMIRTTENTD